MPKMYTYIKNVKKNCIQILILNKVVAKKYSHLNDYIFKLNWIIVILILSFL